MARIAVGYIARRTEDGGFVEDRPIMRDVPDESVGPSGLTKNEERHLGSIADVFAELIERRPDLKKALEK